MSNFLSIFEHLLPKGRAWTLTINKRLRQFFDGLGESADDVKEYFDGIYGDIFPQTTRELDRWEDQFALPSVGLSEQARRDRLAATWQAFGGQDPAYIQQTLRAAGFDVYVYDWWEESSRPAVGVHGAATPHNPLLVIASEFTGVTLGVDCGESFAACGESFAECGNTLNPQGGLLVNKVNESYIVPNDPTLWPYFVYIGGPTFDSLAQISASRQNEFEKLCLQICPTQLWIGVLVEYV